MLPQDWQSEETECNIWEHYDWYGITLSRANNGAISKSVSDILIVLVTRPARGCKNCPIHL